MKKINIIISTPAKIVTVVKLYKVPTSPAIGINAAITICLPRLPKLSTVARLSLFTRLLISLGNKTITIPATNSNQNNPNKNQNKLPKAKRNIMNARIINA